MSKTDTPKKTHFAMIPMCASMELDPYELALYVNYMQTCGCDGVCTKSNKTLAEETGMSVRKVQMTRKTLAEKGYIEVLSTGNESPPRVKICQDIWQKNYDEYANHTPAQDAPLMQDVHDSANISMHKVHTPPASHANEEDSTNKIKEKETVATATPSPAEPEKPKTDYELMWDEISDSIQKSGYDITLEANKKLIGKIRRNMKDNNFTSQDVKPFMRHVYQKCLDDRRTAEMKDYLYNHHYAEFKRDLSKQPINKPVITRAPDWWYEGLSS